jgi:hypothetical protein
MKRLLKPFVFMFLVLNTGILGINIKTLYDTYGNHKKVRCKYDLASYKIALAQYHADFGFFPKDLEGLFKEPKIANAVIEWPKNGYFRRHIKPMITNPVTDPWGMPYVYENQEDGYVLYSEDHEDAADVDEEKEDVFEKQAETESSDLYKLAATCGSQLVLFIVFSVFLVEILKNKEADIHQEISNLLLNIMKTIGSQEMMPAHALYLVTVELSKLFHVMRCAILMVKGPYKASSIASQDNPELKEFDLNLLSYPELLMMINTKESVIVDQLDIITDSNVMAGVKELVTKKGIKAIMVEPIFDKQKIIGALFIRTSGKKKTFSSEEIEICRAVARNLTYLVKEHPSFGK